MKLNVKLNIKIMLENDNKIKIDCINQRIDNMARHFLELKNEIDVLKKENTELKFQLGFSKKQEPIIENDTIDTEQWYDIVGWEGYYQISNLGNVKSMNREFINRSGGRSVIAEKRLNIFFDSKRNAEFVNFSRNGMSYKIYLKDIITTKGFIYPNIEYCILQYDTNRKLIHKWNSLKEIEEQTPYNVLQISKCCKNKSKKYNNYYWERVELNS